MMSKPRGPDKTTYAGRFAARLRELRVAAGLSQAEVAKRLDVKQSTVSLWESGERAPSLNQLPAIAYALGVNEAEKFFPKFPENCRLK